MTQLTIGSEEIEIPTGSPWEKFTYLICVSVVEKMMLQVNGLNMQQIQGDV